MTEESTEYKALKWATVDLPKNLDSISDAWGNIENVFKEQANYDYKTNSTTPEIFTTGEATKKEPNALSTPEMPLSTQVETPIREAEHAQGLEPEILEGNFTETPTKQDTSKQDKWQGTEYRTNDFSYDFAPEEKETEEPYWGEKPPQEPVKPKEEYTDFSKSKAVNWQKWVALANLGVAAANVLTSPIQGITESLTGKNPIGKALNEGKPVFKNPYKEELDDIQWARRYERRFWYRPTTRIYDYYNLDWTKEY